MRMRKKKHGEERLAACAAVMIKKPETPMTDTVADFGESLPIWLEIGCGKGGFACRMSQKHPDVAFYAMEKIENVMVIAVERAMKTKEEREKDHLRFAVGDAAALEEWFGAHTVDRIFLNFSDPWPKKRNAKRRLTNRAFIERYLRVLRPGGKIIFKTDNRGLFDYTLEELSDIGITPDFVTYDLHNSEYAADNVMTEYEENFVSMGMPIHMLAVTAKETTPA